MRNSVLPTLAAVMSFMAVSCGNYGNGIFEMPAAGMIDGLHASWDGIDDNTKFRCFCDRDNLYFFYEVKDSTVTLTENFKGESDVEPEDRVEIFFSPESDMRQYYCAEIDPLGRVLDYSCRFPSIMDYSWNFSTLETLGRLTGDGYSVYGKISKNELERLGLKPCKTVYIGVFRADFHADGTVNWYSYVETDDESPFFHKPDMLFRAVMR